MTAQRWILLGLTWCAVSCGNGGHGADAPTPRVLVLGIDGLRPDALQAASTPAIDALIGAATTTYNAVAGGELGTPTEQRTLSGPGWSSILTGVWVDKHGVEFNTFEGSRFDRYPHFYARIREIDPSAYLSSFATWSPIHEEILGQDGADVVFSPGAQSSLAGDTAVTAEVVAHLDLEDPDVVFVHLDNPDAAGHSSAFSPESSPYISAIEGADRQVGDMIAAVRARSRFAREDWLFIVVTDHGGAGNLHGGQSMEERTVPMIVSRTAGEAVTVGEGPGHVAVPPTVFEHLGLRVDPGWGWETGPFGR
ncbi:MAG: alkaline phosphatase family protein [Myxococcota bacterium]